MKKIFVVLLFSFSISTAQKSWQKGTIFLKDDAVVEGILKLPIIKTNMLSFSGKEKVKYKADMSQRTKKYFEKDIDSIVLSDNSLYRFIQISETKKSLCKLVQKGKVTLYSRQVVVVHSNQMYMGTGNNGGWVTTAGISNYPLEYYAFKKNQKIASAIVKYGPLGVSFKRNALEYFKDCEPITAKIKDKTYRKEDIVAIVEEYNNCSKH